jgi:hypothetical protein
MVEASLSVITHNVVLLWIRVRSIRWPSQQMSRPKPGPMAETRLGAVGDWNCDRGFTSCATPVTVLSCIFHDWSIGQMRAWRSPKETNGDPIARYTRALQSLRVLGGFEGPVLPGVSNAVKSENPMALQIDTSKLLSATWGIG